MSLDGQRDLQTFEHIVGISVRAHTEQDTLFKHLEDRRTAHGVAHIALGIVDDHRIRRCDLIHLRFCHMDTVTEDGFLTEDTPFLEPLNREHMIILAAVDHIVQPLADVDMVPCSAVVRLDAFFKGLVGERKQRVHTKHRRQHRIGVFLTVLDKVGILLDRFLAFCFTVAIGNLIAQAGANAHLFRAVSDREQRSRDLLVARVMIEHRRHTVADALQIGSVSARPGIFQGQLTVELPPHPVEDLIKIRGIIAVDRKTSGKPRVDMRMRVDERGHDQLTACVDKLRLRILLFHLG